MRNALVVVIALIVCLSLMFETYAHLLLDAQLAQLCCGHCTGVWAALVLTFNWSTHMHPFTQPYRAHEKLHEHTPESLHGVIHTVFQELTVLGFVSLFAFVALQTHVPGKISKDLFGAQVDL